MPGYFIYCRKSSEAEDRQVLSIESQVQELRDIAAKLNLSVLQILTEAKSAKEPGRPVFNSMMQRLNRGEAAGVICWKLDRLARNPMDGGAIIWAIKQHGIRVITPTQSYARDDDNVILMYIEFGMAQKYIDDLSRNTRRGLKAKVERGWYPGVAPAGYLNAKNSSGQKYLVKDPERFPLIQRMWVQIATGLKRPKEVLELANNEWGYRSRTTRKSAGKPLSRSGFYHILRNTFYCGWFEYPRGSHQWHQGQHEPMVSESEYDRVQALLGRYGNPRPRLKKVFPYAGLIQCGECGSMVTAEEKHQLICSNCHFKFAYRKRDDCPHCHTLIEEMEKPQFLHYTYYHCTRSRNRDCPEGSIAADVLENQMAGFLAQIQISDDFKKWATKYVHELHQNESQSRNHIVETQQKAYQACLRQLDNLLSLKTSSANADGSMLSDEEYGRRRFELLKEKARFEEMMRDIGHRVETWLKLTEQTLEFACAVKERFAKGDFEAKKEILVSLGSNLKLKAKKLIIEARKPFFFLAASTSRSTPLANSIEPERFGAVEPSNDHFHAQLSNGLRGLDDVRTYGDEERDLVRTIYNFFRSLPDPTREYFFLRRN